MKYTRRKKKENDVSIEVLALMIDKKKFTKHGFKYIEKNKDKIAVDSASFLDLVKLNIERLLKEKIVTNDEFTPPPLIEEKETIADNIINVSNEMELLLNQTLKDDADIRKKKKRKMRHPEDSPGFHIGVSLLQSTTRTDFENIRKKIIDNLKLESEDVPTFYYMTKGRPNVTHGEQPILDDYKILSRESKINKDNNNKLSETKKKNSKKLLHKII